MSTTLILVILGIAAFAAAVYFIPGFGQLLRIRSAGAVKKGSTAVERVSDRVQQAINKLPAQRELVAKQMSAADRASTAAQNKRSEVETLFGKVQIAINGKASDATVTTLKTQWLTAKNAVPGLDQAATAAHAAADEAQTDLNDMIELIQTSAAGVEQLKSDANLASIYRQNAQFRQQLADMKSGLGDMAADTQSVQDDLNTAKHLDELSKGTTADREMAEIEKKAKGATADDEFAKELAARSAAK